MKLRGSVLSFLLLGLVYGAPRPAPQPNISPPTPSYQGGPGDGGKNWDVDVAKVAHAFSPTQINATIGDTITFHFYPYTHSATMADFDAPCVPWSIAHPGEQDTWSGLITENQHRINPQTWVYRVTTKVPRFFYCGGPSSCTQWGMSFAVNPDGKESWEDFHDRAMKAQFQLNPGESPPTEDGSDPNSKKKKSGLPTGAIVGIVIGGVAVIALIGLILYLFGRLKSKKEGEKLAAGLMQGTAPYVGANPQFMHHMGGTAMPPGYEGTGYYQTQPGWDGKATPAAPAADYVSPVSPSLAQGHWQQTGPSGPSELGGVVQGRAEIFTPGPEDQISEASGQPVAK